MKLASKFALLIVSACAVSFLCASSCASTEAKKQQQMAELTPEQIANMSSEEVAQYYARRTRLRAEQARRQAEEDPSFLVVDCAAADGSMLDPDAIFTKIKAIVDEKL